MMTKRRGQSIRIYLVDGTTSGVMVASMPNWAGSVVIGRNATLPDLLARSEADRPGVYILQGPDRDNSARQRAYIGQAARLADRLSQHAKEKAFWELAAVISTGDPNFNAGHYLYLEARLIKQAKEAKRAILDNLQEPADSAGGLGEADIAAVESYLDQVSLVLPVVGIDILRPQPRTHAEVDAPKAQTVTFLLKHGRTGLIARAREIDSEFVVLEGSQALKNAAYSSNTYASTRQELISRGTLAVPEGEKFYVFVADTPFSSRVGRRR